VTNCDEGDDEGFQQRRRPRRHVGDVTDKNDEDRSTRKFRATMTRATTKRRRRQRRHVSDVTDDGVRGSEDGNKDGDDDDDDRRSQTGYGPSNIKTMTTTAGVDDN